MAKIWTPDQEAPVLTDEERQQFRQQPIEGLAGEEAQVAEDWRTGESEAAFSPQVQSTVYPWSPQTLNFSANQWISAHRAELQNDTSFFDEAMERDLAPLRHDFKEAILYLEPKIAAKRASGDEQEVDRLQGYLDNIREASSKLETKFGRGTPGAAHEDEMIDFVVPPDTGVATERAVLNLETSDPDIVAATGRDVHGEAEMDKQVYAFAKRSVALNDAGTDYAEKIPAVNENIVNIRDGADWTGTVPCDSDLGQALLATPGRDATRNLGGRRYVCGAQDRVALEALNIRGEGSGRFLVFAGTDGVSGRAHSAAAAAHLSTTYAAKYMEGGANIDPDEDQKPKSILGYMQIHAPGSDNNDPAGMAQSIERALGATGISDRVGKTGGFTVMANHDPAFMATTHITVASIEEQKIFTHGEDLMEGYSLAGVYGDAAAKLFDPELLSEFRKQFSIEPINENTIKVTLPRLETLQQLPQSPAHKTVIAGTDTYTVEFLGGHNVTWTKDND